VAGLTAGVTIRAALGLLSALTSCSEITSTFDLRTARRARLDATAEPERHVERPAQSSGGTYMKTIGIVGGIAWPSSIVYYRIINERIAHADPVMVDRESRQINRDRKLLTNAVVAHGDNEYADSTSNPPYSNTSYSRSAATG
jgi:hypothetical protein